ncbi:MAG: hypothetical protein JRE43_07905 [Deltaproteobacteria bacterium]|nr:hypothetical protein [Deltaproteobacteria bacterium]
MSEIRGFGRLSAMRLLSVLIFSIYLCVGASPCIGGITEMPAHVPHAEGVANAHADCETRALRHATEHRHGTAASPQRELQARCPCGCEDGQAAANSFVRLGNAIRVCAVDPASIRRDCDVFDLAGEYTQASPQSVDHVPISS